jgi:hypothetical protein
VDYGQAGDAWAEAKDVGCHTNRCGLDLPILDGQARHTSKLGNVMRHNG